MGGLAVLHLTNYLAHNHILCPRADIALVLTATLTHSPTSAPTPPPTPAPTHSPTPPPTLALTSSPETIN